MIHCQSCHYEAIGPIDLASHIMAAHGFDREAARVEAARIAGVEVDEQRHLVWQQQRKIENIQAALDASTIAHNRMRAALHEANEAMARGDLLSAQAAIKRGLGEGE